MNMLRAAAARLRALTVVAVIAMIAGSAPAAAPELRHLRGIAELKQWFNAGQGHPRLIFLLSPT